MSLTSGLSGALQAGHIIGGGHRIEQILGKGGFGITYRATTPSGDYVAIKEFFPDRAVRRYGARLIPVEGQKRAFEKGYALFKAEAETLRRMPRHSNIVGVRALFEKNDTIYMVMDFIDGQQLMALLRAGKVHDTLGLTNLLGELTMALGHLHDNHVLHCDIKPQNIMVRSDTGRPVLIDFGAVRDFRSSSGRADIMTEGYAPIEMLDPSIGEMGPWSDIYSLGVVGYMAATGKKPPSAIDRIRAIRQTGQDPVTSCEERRRPEISAGLAGIIDTCLKLAPGDRPLTALELASLLRGDPAERTISRHYGRPKSIGINEIARSDGWQKIERHGAAKKPRKAAAPGFGEPNDALRIGVLPGAPRTRQSEPPEHAVDDPGESSDFMDADESKRSQKTGGGPDWASVILTITVLILISVIVYAILHLSL